MVSEFISSLILEKQLFKSKLQAVRNLVRRDLTQDDKGVEEEEEVGRELLTSVLQGETPNKVC